MKRIEIMGVAICDLDNSETVSEVKKLLRQQQKIPDVVYTPNTEIVMMCQKDDSLKSIINGGSLILPDGVGLVIGSKIRKKPLRERVTGFDISVALLQIAKENRYKVFLLGGAPGVANLAAENIRIKYGDIICGYQHGYFKGYHSGHSNSAEEQSIIERINRLKPDILFVGFGSPRQEKWINHFLNQLNVRLIIGNGGTIDVLSGQVKRAPLFFQRLGLEWLYRLMMDPKRIRRQILLPLFLVEILLGPDDMVKTLEN
ncbi:MAG: N-acetylmannosaminyltransferase [Clostridiales bacterium 38_11]|nr:MAG: N-acetylmannosaminyltransferase [Clostridiales bacterium 38_11]HBH12731.1 glycosyltransferase [Clostridiales bacterium]